MKRLNQQLLKLTIELGFCFDNNSDVDTLEQEKLGFFCNYSDSIADFRVYADKWHISVLLYIAVIRHFQPGTA